MSKIIGFDPNQVTFEEGIKRVEGAVKKLGLNRSKILTSRDQQGEKARRLLEISNIPGGFVKWQLPVFFEKPSQMFITIAAPHSEVPEHSHNEGAGIRFIAGGSIIYNGQELSAGDWMFVPQGAAYSFKVGPNGATMCYCYECCCAGRRDLQDLVDPAPDVLIQGA